MDGWVVKFGGSKGGPGGEVESNGGWTDGWGSQWMVGWIVIAIDGEEGDVRVSVEVVEMVRWSRMVDGLIDDREDGWMVDCYVC